VLFLTGKAEDIMVFIKVFILLVFVAVGVFSADFHRLSPEYWESSIKIITGGLIIFLAYEGFELIANTAKDIENPQKKFAQSLFCFRDIRYFSLCKYCDSDCRKCKFCRSKKKHGIMFLQLQLSLFSERRDLLLSP